MLGRSERGNVDGRCRRREINRLPGSRLSEQAQSGIQSPEYRTAHRSRSVATAIQSCRLSLRPRTVDLEGLSNTDSWRMRVPWGRGKLRRRPTHTPSSPPPMAKRSSDTTGIPGDAVPLRRPTFTSVLVRVWNVAMCRAPTFQVGGSPWRSFCVASFATFKCRRVVLIGKKCWIARNWAMVSPKRVP